MGDAEKREAGLLLYLAVAAPLGTVDKNLGCIGEMWSTSDDMDHRVCGNELKNGVVKVEEW